MMWGRMWGRAKKTQPVQPQARSLHDIGVVTHDVCRPTYGMLGLSPVEKLNRIDRLHAINRAGSEWDRYTREQLVAQSRQLIRENLLYSAPIDSACSFAFGRGAHLRAGNAIVDMLWDDATKNIEITGRYPGELLVRALGRELLITGEAICKVVSTATDGIKLQMIESEQVRSSNTTDSGIVYDDTGRPKIFRIFSWADGSSTDVAASSVLYVADKERPSSQRGIPPLAPAMPMIHRINDVCDGEALSWQMLSRLFLRHQQESDGDVFAPGTVESGVAFSEAPYAVVAKIGPNDTLDVMPRNIPGANFSESFGTFCRLVGLPLGTPLELILMDYTKSNYSQARGVLKLTYQRYLELQGLMVQFFYEPLFRVLFADWVARGLVDYSRENYAHEFILPTFPWLDALEETNAWREKIRLGIETQTRACKAAGHDRREIINERDREIREAIDRANAIEQDTGVTVPYQIFCGLELGLTESAILREKNNDE